MITKKMEYSLPKKLQEDRLYRINGEVLTARRASNGQFFLCGDMIVLRLKEKNQRMRPACV